MTGTNGLLCWAASHTDSITIGLFANGVAVDTIVAYDLNIPRLDNSNTSFINPATYLGNYTGTYTSAGVGYISDENLNTIEFTTTSVMIKVAPAPRPCCYFLSAE